MTIDIQFVGHNDFILDDPSDCDNSGVCCFGCPLYDACDHHYDETD